MKAQLCQKNNDFYGDTKKVEIQNYFKTDRQQKHKRLKVNES